MEDQNAIIIMKAIGDMKSDLVEKIGSVNTTVAGFHADLNARVQAVESDMVSQKKWGRVNTALMPVYALIHGISSHLGWKL
jgi:hypothetical protein